MKKEKGRLDVAAPFPISFFTFNSLTTNLLTYSYTGMRQNKTQLYTSLHKVGRCVLDPTSFVVCTSKAPVPI